VPVASDEKWSRWKIISNICVELFWVRPKFCQISSESRLLGKDTVFSDLGLFQSWDVVNGNHNRKQKNRACYKSKPAMFSHS
jgi:hypothetical protein